MSEYLDTKELMGVMEELPRPNNFILEALFSDRETFESEKIAAEHILDRTDGLAPFVHYENDPVSVKTIGSEFKEYSPAYIKFETPFFANDYIKRMPGESFYGSSTPEARLALDIERSLRKHNKLVENRLEWMGMKTLLDGEYTIQDEESATTGKNQGTNVINFGRESVLEPAALTGTDVWYDISDGAAGTTSDPLEDIQAMIDTVAEETGAQIDTMIVGKNAWKGLKKHQDFMDLLNKDFRNGETSNFRLDPQVHYGAQRKGKFNEDLEIWTYTNWYDIDNTKYPYMDPNKVLFIDSRAFQGGVLFGLIRDIDFLQAQEKYTKRVQTGNFTKVDHIFTQSAPLVIPGRINATAVMEVVSA